MLTLEELAENHQAIKNLEEIKTRVAMLIYRIEDDFLDKKNIEMVNNEIQEIKKILFDIEEKLP
ncbi:MAG: hypothetical protein NC112_02645 [Oxalobacter formigenes]|nr:hypothetical protein [Oxalobacter formigenes]